MALLSPLGPQFFKNDGTVAAGCRLYTFQSGTTTQQNAFTDQAGATPHTYVSDGAGGTYIALDSAGKVQPHLWLTSGVEYRLRLNDSFGALIDEWDDISGISSVSLPIADASVTVQRTEANSVATTAHDWIQSQPVNVVTDFGADPTGVSSSLTAFQNAFAASKNVYIPPGTYDLGSASGGTTLIDLTSRGDGINITTGPGVLLKCATSGASGIPYFFELDANNDFSCGDIAFEDTAGDNTITWKGAFGFYVRNTTPTNWGNIRISSIRGVGLTSPFAVQSAGSSTNRVRGIHIGQIDLVDCYYGPILQNDGDSAVFANVNCDNCVRPLFVYGVSGVRAKVYSINNLGTSGAVHISRQTGGLNTSDVRVQYTGRNAAGGMTHVLFSHTDISGGSIDNCEVSIDLEGAAVYSTVRFVTYNSGAEYAPSTSNVINNITIRGRCDSNGSAVTTPSAFSTKGRLWFYGDANLTLASAIRSQFRIGLAANGNTPTWASSGTQPAIGNGTLTSNFAVADGVCTETMSITMGSTTTYGTGDWTLSTAFAATQNAIGSVYMRDATGNFWTGVCRIAAGAQAIAIYANNAAAGVNATNPFTWAQSDVLEATISYRIAQ